MRYNIHREGVDTMTKATIQLETLTCPSCVAKIEGALKKMDGIDQDSAKISFSSSRIRLDFNESEVSLNDIENAISKLGYRVEKSRVSK